ncbi:MAG TPA: SusC/RagA family TonB-linked outer membrane protein [Prolixibacteraceae bacterium]|jgi:TonB-linked SusC/RagA family outer membrane protein
MKKIKKTIILILALFSFTAAFSQTKTTIRGKVIDQKDKSAVIGATIVESDKQNRVVNGSITDIDGNFVYQMKNPDNVMKVTVIGFQTKVFKPNPLKPVVIELVSSDIELDQVTITAKVKSDNSLTNIADRDRASSSVKVDLMQMKDGGISNAADALQGKVAGLDIISASGDPGSGSQIVIRGLSSIGNNKPLIVIDGIAQDNVPSSFDLSSSDSQDISNMINVALQDIKSIEVLKDAASTAVYGSKGADGVLLIETNRGKMGKVQFNYTYKNSVNFQPPSIPMLNGDEYVTLQLEEWHNSRGVFDLPREIAYDKDYPDFYNYSANTDWLGAITRNSVTNDHYFVISGGGEKTRYLTSFSYVDEAGTTINTGSKRFSTRVNLDYFLSKKLVFTVQFNYGNNKTDGNMKINNRNIRQMAYLKAPNMSIWEHDAMGNLTGEYFTRNFDKTANYQGNGDDYYNPVAVANLGKSDESQNTLENSFKLKYTIKDWLIFKETAAFQYNGTKSNSFLPYNAIGANWFDWTINKAEENNSLYSSFKTESQLVFFVPFKGKDHELSGATSWSTNQSNLEEVNIQSNKNPSINLQDPAIGSAINYIGSGLLEKSDVGALLNLNYKYKDLYGIQATARADGNSSFGAANRWGLFKGIGGFWRFSDEPFVKKYCSEWLSESKFRVSWGTSGRAPGDWPRYPRFAIYKTTEAGSYIKNPAVVPTSIQLDNLKWESIQQTDFGLELNLFHERLYIEGDIYKKLTSDLTFKEYKIPTSSGYDQLVYLNGGELSNDGWELMLSAKVIRKKDILWSVDFNTSQNVNAFTKLPENFNNEKSTDISNGQFPKRIVAGEPIGSFFGFRYKGVYASDEDAVAKDGDGNKLYDGEHNVIPMTYKGTYPFKGGDAKYEDINHDGQIDLNDVVYIGDSNPDFVGGFGTSLKYKQFDISFQFHYRVGFDIINSTAMNTEGMDGKNNQSKAVLNRWRVQGQQEVGLLPRAYMGNPANNLGSDRYVEKGDFMRLNNITLKYQLSPALCNKLNLQSGSFSLSARKLYTFTNYSGQDPEISADASDPFWIGEDKANTPPPKMVTLSFSVGF